MPPSLSPNGFVSTKEAAKGSGYSADYLSRLARAGHVRGELVGRAWFVDPASLAVYLAEQKLRRQERLDALSRSRVVEYQARLEAGRTPHTKPAVPSIAMEGVRRVVEVSTAPLVGAPSPVWSPVLRPAGRVVPAFSFVAACAVVAAGMAVGSTSLLPNAGARVMAIAGTTSDGFAVMTEPLRTHIASALTRPPTFGKSAPRTLAIDFTLFTRPPPLMVATSTSQKTAVLTNNQAVKSHFESAANTSSPHTQTARNLGTLQSGRVAMRAIATGAQVYVRFIHALIALEARIAYVVGPASNDLSRLAVTAVGTIGGETFGITNAGALALRAGGAIGGQQALAFAHGALGGRGSPQIYGNMPTPSLGAAIPNPREGIRALGTLATVMYGRVPGDAGRIARAPASGFGSAKNIAQNIVSSATASTKSLFASAPAATQLAAADSAEANGAASVTEAAAPGPQTLPSIVSVPITGTTLSYGDLIAYDDVTKAYTVAEGESATVIGVAIENPPLILGENGGIPIVKNGRALVNVTDENGPIAPGDGISLSRDVPGKAVKALVGATGIVGVAREAFTGEGTTTSVTVGSRKVALGTIVVDVASPSGGALGGEPTAGARIAGCTSGSFWCDLESKVINASLLTLLRYLLALLVAGGALYVAFRIFLTDAVSGVVSVGRNPRAKAAIQAMVVFNGVLAVIIAAAGLSAALGILFIQL